MFKNTNPYQVDTTARISDIFQDGLPSNAFLDKGRCAIGGTHSELYNQTRCSIIVVPNISIIKDKLNNLEEIDGVLPTLIGVWGEVSKADVIREIRDKQGVIKIMTTPEGMRKVMSASKELGRLDEVYQSWFLLLDESHTFISEAYRKDILAPFDYFWEFEHRSIISATPYYFSDRRFYNLEHHKITFGEQKLGKITLVNATSVVGTLNFLLQNLDQFPGNIHIFYNSVTEICSAVTRAVLTDCSIFCADDKDKANIKKLEVAKIESFYKEIPSKETYSKVNFYTCKYFEGWNLNDKDATAVLVTDVYKPHTKIGVGSKGKQAIGRLRDKPFQIIHITNHSNNLTREPLEKIRKAFTDDAELLIKQHNEYVKHGKTGKFRENERLKFFANVDPQTNEAKINLNLLDQQINESANNEIYNHIDYIRQDWEDAYCTSPLKAWTKFRKQFRTIKLGNHEKRKKGVHP